MKHTALIIVDVQNDFCPGGALAVPRGDEVVGPLNNLIRKAGYEDWFIVATRDWHPRKTTHFAEFGGQWPAHCVQGTDGAKLHSRLFLDGLQVFLFSKGMGENENAYSGFDGQSGAMNLESLLRILDVETVYVGGLATDYCVKATALDAVERGFKTYLVFDACRAVNVNLGDGDKAIQEMTNAGVIITTSEEVLR